MGIPRQININKSGTSIAFDPPSLNANVTDQIFWTNNDDKPHWPGRLKQDGTIETTFFMPNQIAPNQDTSPIFSSGSADTFNYMCSIAGHESEPGGTVIVK